MREARRREWQRSGKRSIRTSHQHRATIADVLPSLIVALIPRWSYILINADHPLAFDEIRIGSGIVYVPNYYAAKEGIASGCLGTESSWRRKQLPRLNVPQESGLYGRAAISRRAAIRARHKRRNFSTRNSQAENGAT